MTFFFKLSSGSEFNKTSTLTFRFVSFYSKLLPVKIVVTLANDLELEKQMEFDC